MHWYCIIQSNLQIKIVVVNLNKLNHIVGINSKRSKRSDLNIKRKIGARDFQNIDQSTFYLKFFLQQNKRQCESYIDQTCFESADKPD